MIKPGYAFVMLCIIGLSAARAVAVPHVISYQGRIADEMGFQIDGTGTFKFSLVDASGLHTYWSHDGTAANGQEPASFVTLPVSRGRFSALLGDTTLPNMQPLPATVFTNQVLFLRVWFSRDAGLFAQMGPDVQLASVGYALTAEISSAVADGAITAQMIAPNAVTAAKLAPGAVRANLEADHLAGVASGGIILSPSNSPALSAEGYVQIGSTLVGNQWIQRFPANPPEVREGHTAVWTGSEMIVWGGSNSLGRLRTGGRYNPTLNQWLPVSTVNAPLQRTGHSAVWTGSEMIIWGGRVGSFRINDGAAYNPVSDSWAPLPADGAPAVRDLHSAIWTGSEMIIWGGNGASGRLATGARYSRSAHSWTALPAAGAPSARFYHTAVWTGTEMIVFGGSGNSGKLGDGARYAPAANAWTALSAAGAPSAREKHTAVWTGTSMVIWGGKDPAGNRLGDGGSFTPASGLWLTTPASKAPVARSHHTAVWTGQEMIIWGGQGATAKLSDGARYVESSGAWTALPTPSPSPRIGHTAVWTGGEMVIFGGYLDSGVRLNDTFAYAARREMLLYLKP